MEEAEAAQKARTCGLASPSKSVSILFQMLNSCSSCSPSLSRVFPARIGEAVTVGGSAAFFVPPAAVVAGLVAVAGLVVACFGGIAGAVGWGRGAT